MLRAAGKQHPERVTAADAVRISDRDCVEGISSYIGSNLSSDLSTKTLCDIAHVSEGKMILAFRNVQKETPQSYIRAQRLEYGRRLLLDENRKISEIAKARATATRERSLARSSVPTARRHAPIAKDYESNRKSIERCLLPK